MRGYVMELNARDEAGDWILSDLLTVEVDANTRAVFPVMDWMVLRDPLEDWRRLDEEVPPGLDPVCTAQVVKLLRSDEEALNGSRRSWSKEQFGKLLDEGRGMPVLESIGASLRDRIAHQRTRARVVLRGICQSGRLLDPISWQTHQSLFEAAGQPVEKSSGDGAIPDPVLLGRVDVSGGTFDETQLLMLLADFITGPEEAPSRMLEAWSAGSVIQWSTAAGALDKLTTLMVRHIDCEEVITGFLEGSTTSAAGSYATSPVAASINQLYARQIGKALADLQKDNGIDREFCGQKTRLYAWAGKKIDRGPSTAITAIKEAGCFVSGTQGRAGDGLEETIKALIDFASENSGSPTENF